MAESDEVRCDKDGEMMQQISVNEIGGGGGISVAPRRPLARSVVRSS